MELKTWGVLRRKKVERSEVATEEHSSRIPTLVLLGLGVRGLARVVMKTATTVTYKEAVSS